MSKRRAQSKDLPPKDGSRVVPELSLNISRENPNISKFAIKIPSLTRPNPSKRKIDLSQELLMSSQKRKNRAQVDGLDELKLELSSDSELRHKMKNSKMMKVSDIFSENSQVQFEPSDRDPADFVA